MHELDRIEEYGALNFPSSLQGKFAIEGRITIYSFKDIALVYFPKSDTSKRRLFNNN